MATILIAYYKYQLPAFMTNILMNNNYHDYNHLFYYGNVHINCIKAARFT